MTPKFVADRYLLSFGDGYTSLWYFGLYVGANRGSQWLYIDIASAGDDGLKSLRAPQGGFLCHQAPWPRQYRRNDESMGVECSECFINTIVVVIGNGSMLTADGM